jgi:hypothetical protein
LRVICKNKAFSVTLPLYMIPDAPSTSTNAQKAAPDNKLLVAENLDVRYGVAQVLWGISFSEVR